MYVLDTHTELRPRSPDWWSASYLDKKGSVWVWVAELTLQSLHADPSPQIVN